MNEDENEDEDKDEDEDGDEDEESLLTSEEPLRMITKFIIANGRPTNGRTDASKKRHLSAAFIWHTPTKIKLAWIELNGQQLTQKVKYSQTPLGIQIQQMPAPIGRRHLI